jgi:hypothetical protein
MLYPLSYGRAQSDSTARVRAIHRGAQALSFLHPFRTSHRRLRNFARARAQLCLAYDLLAGCREMNQCPRVMHTGSHRLTSDDSLGAWLRCERERRKISIASIAASTKILGALFEGLENDDLSRWPDGGLYRRAFVRAYAQSIGLDPQMVVNEFLARFPETPTETAATPAASDEASHHTRLRLTLADTGQWFRGGARVRAIARRFAAAGLDLAVIAVLSAALWMVLDLPFAIAVVACGYHFASILILGNTPGVCTFAGPTSGKDGGNLGFRRAHARILRLLEERGARTRLPGDQAVASFDRSFWGVRPRPAPMEIGPIR